MTTENGLVKADEFIAANAGKVSKRWYPRFHIAPPVGWCNDPNGFCYYQGTWHFFYQFYPYEPKWGPMHWGHVTSKDLVHWQHEKTALCPDKPYDVDGCFTGSGIEKDGRLYLLYTGHVNLLKKPGQPDRIESQCLAVSEDGINFAKLEQNPVIALPENVSKAEDHHFRDPKVWEHEGTYYTVVGAQTEEETGQVLLFKSRDLVQWDFVNVMSRARGNEGFMWECPNFAEFDGHEALIMSPQGVKPEGYRFMNLHQSVAMLGAMDYESGRFYRDEFQLLDHGFDFYAPQVAQAPDGRCLMFGWLAMWESAMPEQADNWACQMTVPRELHYREGRVVSTPAAELESLRQEAYVENACAFSEECSFERWNLPAGELCADFDLTSAEGLAVHFCDGASIAVSLLIEKASGSVRLTRKSPMSGRSEERRGQLADGTKHISLRVFKDNSSLEFFINDGDLVFSTRYYPQMEDRAVIFEPQGGSVLMERGTFYQLADM